MHNSDSRFIQQDERGLSERAQVIMVWWSLAFMYIFGIALWTLLKMLPPPPASWTPLQVAAFYSENSQQIKLGAVICSWVSAFMLPLAIVISAQMERVELGTKPIWSRLQYAGGLMMTVFVVLPPIFFGVAAFTVTRSPEITAVMHELGVITLVTTDQFFIFQLIPIAYVSVFQRNVPHSAFPRWYGYFTFWSAILVEAGALPYLFKSGPFAWDGLFAFWLPFPIFGLWVNVTAYVLLRAISKQKQCAESSGSAAIAA
jgi:hypothetical protein